MKLYAWQPKGHGQLSWFVSAETEEAARDAVEREIARRKALDSLDLDRITDYETSGWGTDYYELTAVEPGVVVANDND